MENTFGLEIYASNKLFFSRTCQISDRSCRGWRKMFPFSSCEYVRAVVTGELGMRIRRESGVCGSQLRLCGND